MTTAALPELRVSDYRRMFAVLEHVEGARDVSEFRELTLESLESVLGYRNTTFFQGPTYATLFADLDPLLNGRMRGLMREYRSLWSRYDVFGLPQSMSLLERTHAASVGEIRTLPEGSRQYLGDWLGGSNLHSVNAIHLRPGGEHALIGIFGADGLVTTADLDCLRVLGRHLSALCKHLPDVRRRGNAAAGLSPRRREVADLVCEGMTNAMIGRTLSLTEGTIKKYVSEILAATSCRSRTELVLRLRSVPTG